jgi:phosphoglycolate phosphatase
MPMPPTASPPTVRAVLFDLDGTLVHTHIDFPRMKRDVLELVVAAGLDPGDYHALDVLGIVDAVEARLLDEGGFRTGVEEALVRIELAACEGATAAEGAVDTLRWLLERGIRVGIVTRNSVQATERVLSQIPLPHEVLLTRAHTPRVKPDPLHLHLALERLEAKPEYSLMVGDHRMDVQAGRAAGTLTAGVLTAERPDDYFDDLRPDLVIRTLPELKTWISPSSS